MYRPGAGEREKNRAETANVNREWAKSRSLSPSTEPVPSGVEVLRINSAEGRQSQRSGDPGLSG